MHRYCLPDLPQGTKARVHSLECCGPERARLYSMGLTPGAEVEVRQDDHGACRITVRDCSLILVHELARHVICDIDGNEDGMRHTVRFFTTRSA